MDNAKIEKIKLLVLDIDGVMTNGLIIIDAAGIESKAFNTLDGHGVKLWMRAGGKAGFLSGRESKPTELRAAQLGVDFCIQGSLDKLPALEKICTELNVTAEEVCFVGDDLPDLPPIRWCGLGVAVANAVEEVKSYADYTTKNTGGNGAVREIIEYMLKATGKWSNLMDRYIS